MNVREAWHLGDTPSETIVTRATLFRDECQEFVTRFFNNRHPLPGAFSSDRLSISAQILNKYCAVVVHIATCFSKKKVMRNIIINSIEKIYDVNCLYIQYLSKIHTKINDLVVFLLTINILIF